MGDVTFKDLAMAVKRLAAYEARKYKTSITFGEVTEIEDGAVRIKLFNGMEIGGAQLVLSMFCHERTIHIPYEESADDDSDADSHVHDEDEMLGNLTIQHTPTGGCKLTIEGDSNLTVTGDPTAGCVVAFRHKHKIHPALPTIKLWRGLIVGDTVVVSEMGDGRYYVHERAAIADGDSNKILNPKEEGMT